MLKYLLNVISPAVCPSCEKSRTVYPLPVCGGCYYSIQARTDDADMLREKDPEKIDPDNSTSPLKSEYSCLDYTRAVRCCVKSFKFYGNRDLIPLFRKTIGSYIIRSGLRKQGFDIILPVPLHRSRERKRGYNQSAMLGEIVSAFLSIPAYSEILIKDKNTSPQSALRKSERRVNLKGSFTVVNSSLIEKKNILIVDDVTTTGATVDECAYTLMKAGASSVSALTLARVR